MVNGKKLKAPTPTPLQGGELKKVRVSVREKMKVTHSVVSNTPINFLISHQDLKHRGHVDGVLTKEAADELD